MRDTYDLASGHVDFGVFFQYTFPFGTAHLHFHISGDSHDQEVLDGVHRGIRRGDRPRHGYLYCDTRLRVQIPHRLAS